MRSLRSSTSSTSPRSSSPSASLHSATRRLHPSMLSACGLLSVVDGGAQPHRM